MATWTAPHLMRERSQIILEDHYRQMADMHCRIARVLDPLLDDVYCDTCHPWAVGYGPYGMRHDYARYRHHLSCVRLWDDVGMAVPVDWLRNVYAKGEAILEVPPDLGFFPKGRAVVLGWRHYGDNEADGLLVDVVDRFNGPDFRRTLNVITVDGKRYVGRTLVEARRRARELTDTPDRHLCKQVAKLGLLFKAALRDRVVLPEADKLMLLDLLLEGDHADLAERWRRYCPSAQPVEEELTR